MNRTPVRRRTAGPAFVCHEHVRCMTAIAHHLALPPTRPLHSRLMPFTPSFCPRCATPMAVADDHGTIRPTCPSCGYVWYRNPVPAAGVILVQAGRVLLVRRAWDPRAGTWCLPAGFMEAGEHPEQSAVRELQEETGVIAQLTGLFGVYAGFDDPRVRAVLILYTGEATGGEERPGDDAEELGWFPLDDLPEDLAFASHRQALAELRERLESASEADRPTRR